MRLTLIALVSSSLLITGCQGTGNFIRVIDTRTNNVYAMRGPIVTWDYGDPAKFKDAITGQKVRIEAWDATIVSQATYDDLVARGTNAPVTGPVPAAPKRQGP